MKLKLYQSMITFDAQWSMHYDTFNEAYYVMHGSFK